MTYVRGHYFWLDQIYTLAEAPAALYILVGLWLLMRYMINQVIEEALKLRPYDDQGKKRTRESITTDEGYEQGMKMANKAARMMVDNICDLQKDLHMLGKFAGAMSFAMMHSCMDRLKKDLAKHATNEDLPAEFVAEIEQDIGEVQELIAQAEVVKKVMKLQDWKSVTKPNGRKVLVKQRSITANQEKVKVLENNTINTKWGKYRNYSGNQLMRELVVQPSGKTKEKGLKYFPCLVSNEGIDFWYEKEEVDLMEPILKKIAKIKKKMIMYQMGTYASHICNIGKPERGGTGNRYDYGDYDLHGQHLDYGQEQFD